MQKVVDNFIFGLMFCFGWKACEALLVLLSHVVHR